MSLFKWSKKAVEAIKEETAIRDPFDDEDLRLKELRAAAADKKKAQAEKEAQDSFYKAYMDAMKYAPKPARVTTTSSSAPFHYGYGGFPAAATHGAYIKLDDLQKLYNIEPYAVIKIAEYFAGLGISTEEQAKELIEELKRV